MAAAKGPGAFAGLDGGIAGEGAAAAGGPDVDVAVALVAGCMPAVRGELEALALDIWGRPELSGDERYAADALAGFLQGHGFAVECPAAPGLPTSLVARWGQGEGGPTLGLLGEYDALPAMSQAAEPVRRELLAGGPGHGCGHNLLGAGSAGAAVLAKGVLERLGVPATVAFFGCPAEETLVGKAAMARSGTFEQVDACLSWHPMGFTCVAEHLYSALISSAFTFVGVGGHAAEAPERTRSATDAAELMAVGANYLREHIPRDAMVSYAIDSAGGAPNVVSYRVRARYYVRAHTLPEARKVFDRLCDVARGAALMTGTEVLCEELATCESTLPNHALDEGLRACLEATPAEPLTPEEEAFAAAIASELDSASVEAVLRQYGMEGAAGSLVADAPVRPSRTPVRISGSSDYSDAGRAMPLAQAFVACAPLGTPAHSWQNTACAGSALGLRGMRRASRVLAACTVLLALDQGLRARAAREFCDATSPNYEEGDRR